MAARIGVSSRSDCPPSHESGGRGNNLPSKRWPVTRTSEKYHRCEEDERVQKRIQAGGAAAVRRNNVWETDTHFCRTFDTFNRKPRPRRRRQTAGTVYAVSVGYFRFTSVRGETKTNRKLYDEATDVNDTQAWCERVNYA